jgi:hypothetical protein
MYRNGRDTLTSNTENIQVFQKKVGIKEKQSGKWTKKKMVHLNPTMSKLR